MRTRFDGSWRERRNRFATCSSVMRSAIRCSNPLGEYTPCWRSDIRSHNCRPTHSSLRRHHPIHLRRRPTRSSRRSRPWPVCTLAGYSATRSSRRRKPNSFPACNRVASRGDRCGSAGRNERTPICLRELALRVHTGRVTRCTDRSAQPSRRSLPPTFRHGDSRNALSRWFSLMLVTTIIVGLSPPVIAVRRVRPGAGQVRHRPLLPTFGLFDAAIAPDARHEITGVGGLPQHLRMDVRLPHRRRQPRRHEHAERNPYIRHHLSMPDPHT